MKTRKTKRKTIRRGGVKITRSEFNNPLQHLIEAIGDAEILRDFAYYNGRENCNILQTRSRVSIIPSEFSGIAYDGGHWKGYEVVTPGKKRVVYDSYTLRLQLEKSNNFCQSFATYIWAKRGDIGPFIPGQYVNNVKLMSQIWLEYFNNILNGSDPRLKTWLLNSLKEGSIVSQEKGWGEFTSDEIIDTLTRLVNNKSFRTQFSTSY